MEWKDRISKARKTVDNSRVLKAVESVVKATVYYTEVGTGKILDAAAIGCEVVSPVTEAAGSAWDGLCSSLEDKAVRLDERLNGRAAQAARQSGGYTDFDFDELPSQTKSGKPEVEPIETQSTRIVAPRVDARPTGIRYGAIHSPDKAETKARKARQSSLQKPNIELMSRDYKRKMPNLVFTAEALKRLCEMSEEEKGSFEKQLGLMNLGNLDAKHEVPNTRPKLFQRDAGNDGRIYYRRENSSLTLIQLVGNKQTQKADYRSLQP
jgi:hypothetical protein